MKTLTVRLPEAVVADVDAEAAARGVSRSDVVRDRLKAAPRSAGDRAGALEAIADLIGSVDHLPADVSRRKKHWLRATGYGRPQAR